MVIAVSKNWMYFQSAMEGVKELEVNLMLLLRLPTAFSSPATISAASWSNLTSTPGLIVSVTSPKTWISLVMMYGLSDVLQVVFWVMFVSFDDYLRRKLRVSPGWYSLGG